MERFYLLPFELASVATACIIIGAKEILMGLVMYSQEESLIRYDIPLWNCEREGLNFYLPLVNFVLKLQHRRLKDIQ